MSVFHMPGDENRLDCSILLDGGIALYCRHEYLREDTAWFRRQGYRVFSFDCQQWSSSEAMHAELQRVLSLPVWYDKNLNALNDCLRSEDIAVPDVGGVVLVLNRFDAFADSPSGGCSVAD